MSTYVRTQDLGADTLMGAALAPLDLTRSVGLVIVFSLFIAAAAQFAIHIGPIPITGQTFAVLLTGALLGSRLGAAAVIAYLIEGAIGLPFFAGGAAGIVRFFGPEVVFDLRDGGECAPHGCARWQRVLQLRTALVFVRQETAWYRVKQHANDCEHSGERGERLPAMRQHELHP